MKRMMLSTLLMLSLLAALMLMTPLGAVAGASVEYLRRYPLLGLPCGLFAALVTFGSLPRGWNRSTGRLALR